MKRMLFIYNPKAGKGEIRNSLSYIFEEFSKEDYQIVVHPTQGPKDATRVTQEYGDTFDMIVCSGGDGTLDEVVTGMQTGRFRRPLGYIPAGSTNDYAQSLGIPTKMRTAARTIMHGKIYQCDLGRLNDGYFVYVAAFGAFVDVSYETPQDLKNAFGHMAYIIKGMQTLPSIKASHMHFESSGQSGTGDFILGMITNSDSVGGLKGIIGPDVTLNDGEFEVTLIAQPPTAVDWPGIMSAMVNRTPSRYVYTFKTARIEMWFDQAVNWTRDGEFGGSHRHVVIENIPKAIPIIIADTAGTAQNEDSAHSSDPGHSDHS